MRQDTLAALPRICRIALVNPNTSAASTERMLASARAVLPDDARLQGHTAQSGQEFIADAKALAAAAQMMASFGPAIVAAGGVDAMIVSGFGDPGLLAIRRQVPISVTGLAEASLAEAARGGRRFSIVTVTPALHDSLMEAAHAHGAQGQLASIRYTEGALADVMLTPDSLERALLQSCLQAIADDGAQVIVIGGGPLAQAAGRLAVQVGIPVIDPVAAAVRLAYARCRP
jgi:Asp/Glu/hydantoin racemase